MPKYSVTFSVHETFEVDVEADDEEQAEAMALPTARLAATERAPDMDFQCDLVEDMDDSDAWDGEEDDDDDEPAAGFEEEDNDAV